MNEERDERDAYLDLGVAEGASSEVEEVGTGAAKRRNFQTYPGLLVIRQIMSSISRIS